LLLFFPGSFRLSVVFFPRLLFFVFFCLTNHRWGTWCWFFQGFLDAPPWTLFFFCPLFFQPVFQQQWVFCFFVESAVLGPTLVEFCFFLEWVSCCFFQFVLLFLFFGSPFFCIETTTHPRFLTSFGFFFPTHPPPHFCLFRPEFGSQPLLGVFMDFFR